MPNLKSVPSELAYPPYPEDTKANGWKPEFDIRRIKQSTTWRLADPKVRSVLLRLWFESWEEIPCGSFENDDELIAAIIDVDLEWFQGYRRQIMRGWILHSDGRFYHPYITNQVLNMLKKRKKEADRVREWREKKALENAKCNALPTCDQRVSNAQEQEQEQEQEYVMNSLSDCRKSAVADSPEEDGEKSSSRRKFSPCPYEKIRALWIEMLPQLPEPLPVENWTPARKTQIRARWRDQLPSLEHWRATFELVNESRFLMGKIQKPGRAPFVATLWWISKPENLSKIYENFYNREAV